MVALLHTLNKETIMTKKELLEKLDQEIEEAQKQYDFIKGGKDFVEQGILLGKINGFLHARRYVINLDD